MHKSIKQSIVMIITAVLFVFPLILCGCTKNNKNDVYISEVNNFYNKLVSYDAKINRIDAKDKNASDELLAILDDMNRDFKAFAELPVPAEAPEAKEHAQNASAFMAEATEYYHKALEGEKVDEMALSNAKLSYGNAVTEIKNVGVALQNNGN